jgi:hypothetical protein
MENVIGRIFIRKISVGNYYFAVTDQETTKSSELKDSGSSPFDYADDHML